jgi:hypothetical protein
VPVSQPFSAVLDCGKAAPVDLGEESTSQDVGDGCSVLVTPLVLFVLASSPIIDTEAHKESRQAKAAPEQKDEDEFLAASHGSHLLVLCDLNEVRRISAGRKLRRRTVAPTLAVLSSAACHRRAYGPVEAFASKNATISDLIVSSWPSIM